MTIAKRMYRPSRNMHPLDTWLDAMMSTPQHYRPRYSEPAANILEGEADFTIELAVPGMKKDDFAIKLEEKMLTISAESDHQLPENQKVVKREFTFGHFNKSFVLPDTIDVEKIDATYEAGILRITLPKTADTVNKLREIKVN